MTCLVLYLSGAVTLSLEAIAVDSEGAIFIGKYERIDVYQDGKLIQTLPTKTSRAYVFTIDDSDLIHLYPGEMEYIIDRNGEILQEKEVDSQFIFSDEYAKRKRFTASDGTEYRIRGNYIWPRVTKNNVTVYRVSVLSFVVNIISSVDIVVFSLSILGLAVRELRKSYQKTEMSTKTEDGSLS